MTQPAQEHKAPSAREIVSAIRTIAGSRWKPEGFLDGNAGDEATVILALALMRKAYAAQPRRIAFYVFLDRHADQIAKRYGIRAATRAKGGELPRRTFPHSLGRFLWLAHAAWLKAKKAGRAWDDFSLHLLALVGPADLPSVFAVGLMEQARGQGLKLGKADLVKKARRVHEELDLIACA